MYFPEGLENTPFKFDQLENVKNQVQIDKKKVTCYTRKSIKQKQKRVLHRIRDSSQIWKVTKCFYTWLSKRYIMSIEVNVLEIISMLH